MKYVVNLTSRNCIKRECECKRCTFNGIMGMCTGHIEDRLEFAINSKSTCVLETKTIEELKES